MTTTQPTNESGTMTLATFLMQAREDAHNNQIIEANTTQQEREDKLTEYRDLYREYRKCFNRAKCWNALVYQTSNTKRNRRNNIKKAITFRALAFAAFNASPGLSRR